MARPLSDAEVLVSVGFADYAAAHPDDEVVVYLNEAQFDPPLTALIRMPRLRVAEERRRGKVPFFRHGDILRVQAAAPFDPKKAFGLQGRAA
jgi:hypothetical protein